MIEGLSILCDVSKNDATMFERGSELVDSYK